MSTVKEEAAVALRELARQYWRRSDNVPLSRSSPAAVERVGDLREVAERIDALADDLDPAGGTP